MSYSNYTRRFRNRWRRTPRKLRYSVYALALVAAALAINWVYQVVRKPADPKALAALLAPLGA